MFMAKKRKQKTKSTKRRHYSPLMQLKLNQMVKSTEERLSVEELDTFMKLSQADKRDVVFKVSENAVDAEITDYFKQLNSSNETATSN